MLLVGNIIHSLRDFLSKFFLSLWHSRLSRDSNRARRDASRCQRWILSRKCALFGPSRSSLKPSFACFSFFSCFYSSEPRRTRSLRALRSFRSRLRGKERERERQIVGRSTETSPRASNTHKRAPLDKGLIAYRASSSRHGAHARFLSSLLPLLSFRLHTLQSL